MTEHQSQWADLLVRRIISTQLSFTWTHSRNLIKMNQCLNGIWLPFIARSCCLLRVSRKGQTKRALPVAPAPPGLLSTCTGRVCFPDSWVYTHGTRQVSPSCPLSPKGQHTGEISKWLGRFSVPHEFLLQMAASSMRCSLLRFNTRKCSR